VTFKETVIAYKWFIIIPLVILLVGGGNFVGGCFYGQHKVTQAAAGKKQEIPKKGTGKAGNIPPVPNDCASYKKCAQSEIFTTFTLQSNVVKIHAYNSCKFKDDEYKIPTLYFPNTTQFHLGVGVGGYDGKVVPIFGGALYYVHHFNPSFGFGGGPFYYSSIDKKLWNAGGNLTAEYSW